MTERSGMIQNGPTSTQTKLCNWAVTRFIWHECWLAPLTWFKTNFLASEMKNWIRMIKVIHFSQNTDAGKCDQIMLYVHMWWIHLAVSTHLELTEKRRERTNKWFCQFNSIDNVCVRSLFYILSFSLFHSLVLHSRAITVFILCASMT